MLENPTSTNPFSQIEDYVSGTLTTAEHTAYEIALHTDTELRDATYASRAIRFWQRKMSQTQMEAYAQLLKSNAEQAEVHHTYQLAFTAAMHTPVPTDATLQHLAALQAEVYAEQQHLAALPKETKKSQPISDIFKYAAAAMLLIISAIIGLKLLLTPSIDTPKKPAATHKNAAPKPIITPEIPANTPNNIPNNSILPQENVLKPAIAPIRITKNTPIAYQKALENYKIAFNDLNKTLQDSLNVQEHLDRLDDQNTKCVTGLAASKSIAKTNLYVYSQNVDISKTLLFKTLKDSANIMTLQIHKNVLETRNAAAKKQTMRLKYLSTETKKALDECRKNK